CIGLVERALSRREGGLPESSDSGEGVHSRHVFEFRYGKPDPAEQISGVGSRRVHRSPGYLPWMYKPGGNCEGSCKIGYGSFLLPRYVPAGAFAEIGCAGAGSRVVREQTVKNQPVVRRSGDILRNSRRYVAELQCPGHG